MDVWPVGENAAESARASSVPLPITYPVVLNGSHYIFIALGSVSML